MLVCLTVDESLDPVVLLPGLEADEVHAPLPAVVPGVEPVPLGPSHPGAGVLPAEVVVPTIKLVQPDHLSPCTEKQQDGNYQLAGWVRSRSVGAIMVI